MQLDMRKADRFMAIFLTALGTAMLIGGYQMDRLEVRQIHPASIPGLVPMILGGLLVLCALLLFASTQEKQDEASGSDAIGGFEEGDPAFGASWRNLLFCMLWSVVFAVFLVGNLPFVVASGLYITVFYAFFALDKPVTAMTSKEWSILAVKAILLGAVASVAISSLFRYGFLVRLP